MEFLVLYSIQFISVTQNLENKGDSTVVGNPMSNRSIQDLITRPQGHIASWPRETILGI